MEAGTDVWEDISQLWDAISLGKEWGIPHMKELYFQMMRMYLYQV